MQINGLELVMSKSTQGHTSLTLQFALEKDIDAAATDVQTAISQASGNLPVDLPSPPTYSKTNPNDQPIMYIALTSESVTEGHPDKMCDQISDAILDDLIRQDPESRVACETGVTTGLVVVMGEITTQGYSDIPKLVRETVRGIGYTNAHYGFDYETCGVIVSLKEQSQDIAIGVDHSFEVRSGEERIRLTLAQATRG